ncbi:Gamma-glutamyltranspeptidase [uncultured Candidatus Thioglobus sp.]|nr:Gamma-glutamyltranspeptidase [uncultured Candidatus Thioglobus sp.]
MLIKYLFTLLLLAVFTSNAYCAKKPNFAVATSHHLATSEALAVLEQGGSAADAAVVTQLLLTLVEPQSSGIGGGAFALFWDNKKTQLSSYDGRETAPLNAQENYFFDANNKPLQWSFTTVRGAKSVGVPGTLALIKKMHDKHGKLDWNDLLDRIIKIADKGYKLDKKIYRNLVFAQKNGLNKTYKVAYNFYFQNNKPKPIGTIIKNPAFAKTLKTIQTSGIQAFYGGSIAQDILTAMQNSPQQAKIGQALSIDDFKKYQMKIRPAICHAYRSWKVCGMGPPSSGALTVGQILSILNNFDMKKIGFSAEAIHLFSEASKLAYADRALYMADSDFVKMPTQGLLNSNYLQQRAKLISLQKTLETPVLAGIPPNNINHKLTADEQPEQPSTSHFNIVDSTGNIISMTTTIEQGFGSGIMVGGFMLNNELTDFSFKSELNGKKIANRVEGGKRPRSSMSPSIIFNDKNQPILTIGSPGGSRIIEYVASSIIAILDWNMPLKKALDLGHFANRNHNITELEANSNSLVFAQQLKKLGHKIAIVAMQSGLTAILINADGSLITAVDRRRE